jgi:serine protease
MLSGLAKSRTTVAALGLVALGTALALAHTPDHAGLDAEGVTPQAIAEIAAELPDASQWTTDNLVLDLLDPQEGEPASEDEIAAWVSALDDRIDVDAAPAAFYSESDHLYVVRGDAAALASLASELEGEPLVEGVEPEIVMALPQAAMSVAESTIADGEREIDKPKHPRFEPNDPMFGLQWHMEQIHAPEAWTITRGEGAVVAVIDTGVAWKDADGVKRLPDLAGTEFVAGESFISGLPEGLDDHAHGSHVAGTIAQTTHNGIGVVGVANRARIMPLKVLSKDGRGGVPGIASAIRYAADHGANVINMSLGGPLPSKILAKAIEYAHGKGVITVCAAGNEHRSRVGYPAANKHAVAVSATDYARQLTFYSNWGKDIDVAAPGGDTRADRNGDGHPDGVLQNTIMIGRPLENDYLWFQGTSMASPHAAGVAALVVASGVTNPDEVERILKHTAVHPSGKTWDEKYGAGIVDARAAVAAAKAAYSGERTGLLGLLALGGLGGLGLAGVATRRARAAAIAGVVGGATVAAGALGIAPLALALASGLGLATWLAFSAAIPLALAIGLLGVRPLRGLLAGLALGWAALLVHGALVLPTLLADLPGGSAIDRLWLAANAVVAFVLARRLSRL